MTEADPTPPPPIARQVLQTHYRAESEASVAGATRAEVLAIRRLAIAEAASRAQAATQARLRLHASDSAAKRAPAARQPPVT